MGCAHTIYSVECIVDHYVSIGSTVNLCALDLMKAFDKMKHHRLFKKLMDRSLPVSFLNTGSIMCPTCIYRDNATSQFIKLECGIRHRGVLFPYLFVVYIDDVIIKLQKLNIGCHIDGTFVGIWFCTRPTLYFWHPLSIHCNN